jgi:hypothetical protein
MRLDRRKLAFETEHAGGDQSFLREEAGVINQESGREVVRAVQHDVVVREQSQDVVRVDMVIVRFDRDVGVDSGQRLPARFDLGFPDCGGRM